MSDQVYGLARTKPMQRRPVQRPHQPDIFNHLLIYFSHYWSFMRIVGFSFTKRCDISRMWGTRIEKAPISRPGPVPSVVLTGSGSCRRAIRGAIKYWHFPLATMAIRNCLMH